ncbi:MAG: type II/IV secretion system ATPase subunit [Candidatus Aenigmatarchaeota archaeon]
MSEREQDTRKPTDFKVRYKWSDMGGLRILNIDTPETLAVPGLRAAVLRLLAGLSTDMLILKGAVQNVYTGQQLAAMTELAAVLKTVPELCEICRKRLVNHWADPLGFYYILSDLDCKVCAELIHQTKQRLKNTAFIRAAIAIADKTAAYDRLMKPLMLPSLLPATMISQEPDTMALESYNIADVQVTIHPHNVRPDMVYFVSFPELSLNSQEVAALDAAFKQLCAARPKGGFEPDRIRSELLTMTSDILARSGVDVAKLQTILMRHTAGYGVLEPLLLDESLQDIYVDSGSGQVHVVHSRWGECLTNIIMGEVELEKLATRLRAISGRPLDASSPVLHAELEDLGIRGCGVCQPSTYRGMGFAFRRRKSSPWTLAEFIQAGMLDSQTAGLLSFLIDGQSSLLVTGPRASGKTSLLTALLLEIPQSTRIILIEDTPEIPVAILRKLGFKIEHLRTEAWAKGFELSTEDALRTSLRLGESTLVIGEVRGPEAKALFEAMRVGAAGNVVLGTIHSSSAFDTWDRVVNDLGVPASSFKAVDIILTTGSIRYGDDVRRHRRLLTVTEIGKDWRGEPGKTSFRDIVNYVRKDNRWRSNLKLSQTIKKIADVKGLSMAKALENIRYRGMVKQALVDLAEKRPESTSASFFVAANNRWLRLAATTTDYRKAYKEWAAWLAGAAK